MSIVTFAKGSNAKLSEHFKMNEFQCKCNGTHTSKIDTQLIDMLEKLYKVLNCSKIIVNSGYRCPDHNKAIAGSGSSKHCDGIAADVVLYGQDNNPISANIVSCIAQDMGFGGIAKINNRGAIHLDVRTGSKFMGDETKNGYSSVTNDFYKYYGVTKEYINQFVNKDININITSSNTEPTMLIKNGDKGESVKWLQSELNKHGYSLIVDGIFGVKTLESTKDFQKKKGLVIDGIVGIRTREALKK